MKKSVILAAALMVATAVPAHALTIAPGSVPQRWEMAVVYDDGTEVDSANAHQPREAMSLAKLYLGHWVLHHGAPEDQALVENMIRFSDDGVATTLDRKYPQAIPETISAFGLGETSYNGYWGDTTTSVSDVARFLQAIRNDAASQPIINGMSTASPIAGEGYVQNYGTSQIKGVQGTKYGWSDDRSVNGTASIGPGYTIAIITFGTAADATSDALGAVTDDSQTAATQLKDKLRCHMDQGSRSVLDQVLNDQTPVPQQVVDAIPGC